MRGVALRAMFHRPEFKLAASTVETIQKDCGHLGKPYSVRSRRPKKTLWIYVPINDDVLESPPDPESIIRRNRKARTKKPSSKFEMDTSSTESTIESSSRLAHLHHAAYGTIRTSAPTSSASATQSVCTTEYPAAGEGVTISKDYHRSSKVGYGSAGAQPSGGWAGFTSQMWTQKAIETSEVTLPQFQAPRSVVPRLAIKSCPEKTLQSAQILYLRAHISPQSSPANSTDDTKSQFNRPPPVSLTHQTSTTPQFPRRQSKLKGKHMEGCKRHSIKSTSSVRPGGAEAKKNAARVDSHGQSSVDNTSDTVSGARMSQRVGVLFRDWD